MKKFNIKKEEYKDMNIYTYNSENFMLLRKVLNKEYLVEKEFKNDKRTYVARILIDNKKYILKKPFNNKVLKKIIYIFKKGESLTVLKNVTILKNKNFIELVEILGAGVKRKNFIIKEEFYLMKCVEGEVLLEDKNLQKILLVSNKIHRFGRYHGDCNPYNFLFDRDKVYILDTKLKKMIFGNYRAHYDILTLMKYFKEKVEYPYKKNIFYYMAYLVRKFRDKKFKIF